MILFLEIFDKNNGQWFLVEDKAHKDKIDFAIDIENEEFFAKLSDLLQKNKINIHDLRGLGLLIRDASLTQVKIFTAVINTFAWQLEIPVAGKYYESGEYSEILEDILDKKFDSLEVKYKQEPEITVSKKSPKYRIKK